MKVILICSLISLLLQAFLKHGWVVLILSYTDLLDINSLVNIKILEEAVCVQSHLHYFERPDISTIESDMETVFIEISKDQLQIDKNILIGVIYRPPATDVRSFNAKLNVYLYKIRKENKICYLLGDFNINLLNHDTHNLTGEFYDLMTSNSFLPLITRPTRITATSATLIDNIFSNYLENCSHSMQGLMVTDISDHYPIFHVNRQVKAKFTWKREYIVTKISVVSLRR